MRESAGATVSACFCHHPPDLTMRLLAILLLTAVIFPADHVDLRSDKLDTGLEKYEIDPEHAFIAFRVERFNVGIVLARFNEVAGTIMFDADDPTNTSADITIQTASFDSALPDRRDKDLKSAFWLDVENHPEITFKTKRIEKTESGYTAIGDLTIKGITNEIELPFTIRGPSLDLPTQLMSIGISGQITINRHDYGLTFDRRLENGAPFIGNEVDIELHVVGLKVED